MPKYDIVSLGESLIDFVGVKAPAGKLMMEGNAGGAPANVMAAAAKLGRRTAYISKVGADAFGDFFTAAMADAGVDTAGLLRAPQPTTLAMVTLDKRGDRSFSFYRNQTADVMLEKAELPDELLQGCRVFHFGTLSMTGSPVYEATLEAVRRAKEAGAAISFDPNYRPLLWASEADAVKAMKEGVALADYVKLSEEEAELLTGESDPEKAAVAVLATYGLRFLAVTLGPAGCIGMTPKARLRLPTYDVACIDTTGAGDAFWGAALHRLLGYRGQDGMDEKSLEATLHFCNAAGSLATMRHGAIPALATEAEIQHCVDTEKLMPCE